jgi:hypothetical protein
MQLSISIADLRLCRVRVVPVCGVQVGGAHGAVPTLAQDPQIFVCAAMFQANVQPRCKGWSRNIPSPLKDYGICQFCPRYVCFCWRFECIFSKSNTCLPTKVVLGIELFLQASYMANAVWAMWRTCVIRSALILHTCCMIIELTGSSPLSTWHRR